MAALGRVDAPPRGVVVLDRDSRVTSANDRAAEIPGTSLRDLIGSTLPNVFARRAEAERPDAVFEEVLEREAVFHRYSAPIYDHANVPAGRVEIYSGITARRELENVRVSIMH